MSSTIPDDIQDKIKNYNRMIPYFSEYQITRELLYKECKRKYPDINPLPYVQIEVFLSQHPLQYVEILPLELKDQDKNPNKDLFETWTLQYLTTYLNQVKKIVDEFKSSFTLTSDLDLNLNLSTIFYQEYTNILKNIIQEKANAYNIEQDQWTAFIDQHPLTTTATTDPNEYHTTYKYQIYTIVNLFIQQLIHV